MPRLLTIAIPTFNDCETLAATLSSLVAQTLPVQSVLVVDDQSSDRTVRIANSFARRLPIRILRNGRNLGLAENWNRCLEESSTSFTWILHSDDWLHPQANELVRSALADFDGGTVFVGAEFFRDTDCPAARLWAQRRHSVEWSRHAAGCEAIGSSLAFVCSGVVIARRAHDAVGGFSAAFPYSPDEELWPRIADKFSSMSAVGARLAAVRYSGAHHMHETWLRPDFKARWWELYDRWLTLASNGLPETMREQLAIDIVDKRDSGWRTVEEYVSGLSASADRRPALRDQLRGAARSVVNRIEKFVRSDLMR